MEEKLAQIVKNTDHKASFLLTLTGKGSKLEKRFEPELSVVSGCHYEIAFTNLETYFSVPNINENNNTFQIQKKGGTYQNVIVEKGCYGLIDLNAEIQRQLKDLNMTKSVQFKANYNTFRCVMIIAPSYAVNFSNKNSLGNVLGFKKQSYKAKTVPKRYISENQVNIMSLNSILVHCNLVGDSYLNGKKTTIIHSFYPNVDPGNKIIEKPVQYIYLPISSDVIRQLTVWLTDQDQKPLDLINETLTIKFHLKSC